MAGAEWQLSVQCQVLPAMSFSPCLFCTGRGCVETKRGWNSPPFRLIVCVFVGRNPSARSKVTSKAVMSESAGFFFFPQPQNSSSQRNWLARVQARQLRPQHAEHSPNTIKKWARGGARGEIPGRVKHTTGQQGLAGSKSTVWNLGEPPSPCEPCPVPPPFLALVWFERSVRVWERSLGIPFFIKGQYYSIALNTQPLRWVRQARTGGGAGGMEIKFLRS